MWNLFKLDPSALRLPGILTVGHRTPRRRPEPKASMSGLAIPPHAAGASWDDARASKDDERAAQYYSVGGMLQVSPYTPRPQVRTRQA